MPEEIDLRAALNAISDVVQNRPRPRTKVLIGTTIVRADRTVR